MGMNMDDTTIIMDTALGPTIQATATMVKMILLINVIIILIVVLVHALARKNHGIQDADHVITMPL
jgi:competence protein ComGC